MFDTGLDSRYDFIAHITWIRSCLYIMYFYIQRWVSQSWWSLDHAICCYIRGIEVCGPPFRVFVRTRQFPAAGVQTDASTPHKHLAKLEVVSTMYLNPNRDPSLPSISSSTQK